MVLASRDSARNLTPCPCLWLGPPLRTLTSQPGAALEGPQSLLKLLAIGPVCHSLCGLSPPCAHRGCGYLQVPVKDGLSFSARTLGLSLELLMGSCCHQGMKTPSLLPSQRQRGTGAKTAKWQQLEARLFPWISVSSSVKWICHWDLPHWVASHQRGIIYRKLSEVSCTREC